MLRSKTTTQLSLSRIWLSIVWISIAFLMHAPTLAQETGSQNLSLLNSEPTQIISTQDEQTIPLSETPLNNQLLLQDKTAEQKQIAINKPVASTFGNVAARSSTHTSDIIGDIYPDRHLLTPIIVFLLLSLIYALFRIRASQIALHTSENRMRHALEGADSGLWDWNIEKNKLYLSQRFETMLGYAPGEIGVDILRLKEFIHPDDFMHVRQKLREHLNGISTIFESEHRVKHKNGHWIWMSGRGKIVNRDPRNRPTRIVGTQTDISARKQTEEQLRQNALVFETISEAVIICDENNHIISVNHAFTEITGYSKNEVIGKNPSILQSGKHDAHYYKVMWDSINNKGVWQGEIWNRNKSGEIYPEWLSIATISRTDGKIDQYIAVFSDITKRKEDEEIIRYQANYDALTELPNRHLLMDRLGFELQRAKREHTIVALMFIDLDRFKPINDTYGHMVGDQLLWEVSKRLTNNVRETDMVARLGGDEFTIVLPNIADIGEVEHMARRILNEIARPFDLNGRELFISTSIGITVYPDDATDISTLMTNADNAMYRAKDEGRNTFCFFTPEMNDHAKEMLRIENDLHHAIQKNELVPYFQPIVDIDSGEVIAAEVLLRWKHPELGVIMPSSFIPITEAAGLIVHIGKWLLEVVCCQVMRWRSNGINLQRICVNISGRQFRDNLVHIVEDALKTSGLEPEYLELEIVETVLLEENRQNANILQQLHDMGVRLTIDDFGTGYSSLSYLKKYPFDVLKINRSFINELPDSKDDTTLVNTIISMARGLGLEVIAEGVELKEQLDYLRDQGCHMAQGFYFTKPIPADKFEKWLNKTL